MSLWAHTLCKPSMIHIHRKCRDICVPYLNSSITRVHVPDEKVKWNVPWPEYNPIEYTDPSILGKPWADPDIADSNAVFKWNSVDGKLNRTSYICSYAFHNNRPLNPMGRTGMSGRGILGRFGPNHAADPVVTRSVEGKLQFVAIQRKDTGEWAIPGGMVDAGEIVSATLKREFSEETLGGVNHDALESLWKTGKELYRGYVDDHRNTDNAWMETVVMHFHDNTGLLNSVNLQAGDDACNVRWVDVDGVQRLYASHELFLSLLKQSISK